VASSVVHAPHRFTSVALVGHDKVHVLLAGSNHMFTWFNGEMLQQVWQRKLPSSFNRGSSYLRLHETSDAIVALGQSALVSFDKRTGATRFKRKFSDDGGRHGLLSRADSREFVHFISDDMGQTELQTLQSDGTVIESKFVRYEINEPNTRIFSLPNTAVWFEHGRWRLGVWSVQTGLQQLPCELPWAPVASSGKCILLSDQRTLVVLRPDNTLEANGQVLTRYKKQSCRNRRAPPITLCPCSSGFVVQRNQTFDLWMNLRHVSSFSPSVLSPEHFTPTLALIQGMLAVTRSGGPTHGWREVLACQAASGETLECITFAPRSKCARLCSSSRRYSTGGHSVRPESVVPQSVKEILSFF